MNTNIETVVENFLAYKRALGRKYVSEDHELRLLVNFADCHHLNQLDDLTPALIDDFMSSRQRSRPRSFNHLLGTVNCLFDWAIGQQLIEVSPVHTRRRRVTSWRIPFLFDTVLARRLLDAAVQLPDNSRASNRGAIYRTIFALCYGLGLRAGEVCGLRLGDVDLDRRLLVIRSSKFGKSRLVPYGPHIGVLVDNQVELCKTLANSWDAATPLFSFDGYRCISPGTASQTFHQLVTSLEFCIPDGVSPPHLHCLRHSFAVGCLLRWYHEGLDPSIRLHQLSTFMGHVDPSSTAVYLTITSALLDEANRRFEVFAEPVWEARR